MDRQFYLSVRESWQQCGCIDMVSRRLRVDHATVYHIIHTYYKLA